ncbi:MAG: nucleotide sugar dehydrogenase, partial [Nitrospirota bacterium]|nr:nucleotide sugar dehydrogenase [Nitrospirota bacterium]
AEMVKLLENTFRSVNIGLVNEIALMSDRMGIDVWEVIDSAATKPFGFMPFYPGPGLGGHCIPIDPFYLSWKAKSYGFEARFIELAGQVNGNMPAHVVTRVADALNDQGKCIKGAKVLILGVAYKKDIDDIRESPALDVIGLLQKKGAKVDYYDPYIPSFDEHGFKMKGIKKLDGACGKYDCAVIITNHSGIDYKKIVAESPCVVDTRNALKGVKSRKVVRL